MRLTELLVVIFMGVCLVGCDYPLNDTGKEALKNIWHKDMCYETFTSEVKIGNPKLKLIGINLIGCKDNFSFRDIEFKRPQTDSIANLFFNCLMSKDDYQGVMIQYSPTSDEVFSKTYYYYLENKKLVLKDSIFSEQVLGSISYE